MATPRGTSKGGTSNLFRCKRLSFNFIAGSFLDHKRDSTDRQKIKEYQSPSHLMLFFSFQFSLVQILFERKNVSCRVVEIHCFKQL
jgi:hypothetical protein